MLEKDTPSYSMRYIREVELSYSDCQRICYSDNPQEEYEKIKQERFAMGIPPWTYQGVTYNPKEVKEKNGVAMKYKYAIVPNQEHDNY